MILSETVKVKLHGRSIPHYESKGYLIPRKPNVNGKLQVPQNTLIEVNVADLQNNSTVKVLCKCDVCGKKRYQKYNRHRNICSSCMRKSQVGKNSPGWKDGRALKKNCIDCGKEIQHKQKRCGDCYQVILDQIRSIKSYCIDCGKEITKGCTRCRACANSGSNNPMYNPDLTDEERIAHHCCKGLKKWRRQVLEKNEFVCQKCNRTGKINNNVLHAHHIFDFKNNVELRTEVDNGITLCFKCHNEFHSLFGKICDDIMLKEYLNGKNLCK